MLKNKHFCQCGNKDDFSASKILNKISSRLGFKVDDYFKPVPALNAKSRRASSMDDLKPEKISYYEPWELKSSMQMSKGFRFRRKEILPKVKLKPINVRPINFEISQGLKYRIKKFSTQRKIFK
jgi:hypothetical protein